MLFALEGAIQGKRWHEMEQDRKQELKEFYRMLKKKHPTTKNILHLARTVKNENLTNRKISNSLKMLLSKSPTDNIKTVRSY